MAESTEDTVEHLTEMRMRRRQHITAIGRARQRRRLELALRDEIGRRGVESVIADVLLTSSAEVRGRLGC